VIATVWAPMIGVSELTSPRQALMRSAGLATTIMVRLNGVESAVIPSSVSSAWLPTCRRHAVSLEYASAGRSTQVQRPLAQNACQTASEAPTVSPGREVAPS